MRYGLENLKEKYELELERIVFEIRRGNVARAGVPSDEGRSVLLQLPDGLKPWGVAIIDYLEEKTSAKISIWLGACFGACDLPNTNADLVIQFGHAPWEKKALEMSKKGRHG